MATPEGAIPAASPGGGRAVAGRPGRHPIADLLLLGARLYAGITIAKAGLDKLPTPDWMVDQVGQIGVFPAARAFATGACLTEFVAGSCLALGLFTRVSAALLAIVMGVASFGYHRLMPFVDMHIAQGFFWLFVALLAVDAGRFSLDFAVRGLARPGVGRRGAAALAVAPVALIAALGIGREVAGRRAEPEEAEIRTVHLAGSFNDWSLTAHPMSRRDPTTWTLDLPVEAPGLVRFKFVGDSDWEKSLGVAEARPLALPATGKGDPRGEDIQVDLPEAGPYCWTLDADSYEFRVERVPPPDPAEAAPPDAPGP